MTYSKNLSGSPLTFDIGQELFQQLSQFLKSSTMHSVSDVVRIAVDSYPFDKFQPADKDQKQVSVRVSDEHKRKLLKISRQKDASIGVLLRTALTAILTTPKKIINSNHKPTPMVTMKKSTTKKVKTTAAKKAVKKAVKKVTKKKAAGRK